MNPSDSITTAFGRARTTKGTREATSGAMNGRLSCFFFFFLSIDSIAVL